MRKRRSFARLGMLGITLLVALCLTGVGYAAWTDEIGIDQTVNMGYVELALIPGACSSPQITCSVSAPDTLAVNLTDAAPVTYTCNFTVTNAGTIPVKIQSIDSSAVPAGVEVSVLGVTEGTQIEQASVHPDSFDGVVMVVLQQSCEGTFSFSVTFSFVQWNMYVA